MAAFLNGEHFNGSFHVFQGNLNDIVYHGSTSLSEYLVLFPAGNTFSATLNTVPNQTLNAEIAAARTMADPEDINSIISRLGNEEPAFFSNLQTSLIYSGGQVVNTDPMRKCNNKCVHVFALNQNLEIMVMNNVYNVCKIIQYIVNNPAFRQLPACRAILDDPFYQGYANDAEKLNHMFVNFYALHEDVFTDQMIINPIFLGQMNQIPAINEIRYRGRPLFGRYSNREWDLPLMKVFCLYFAVNADNLGHDIKGFGNNTVYMGIMGSYRRYLELNPAINLVYFDDTIAENQHYFHPEVVFCKSLKVLNRIYTNPADWQYNTIPDNTRYIGPYLRQLEKCKIINFKDYAGNIYETTIWTLLIYESLSAYYNNRCSMESAPVALLSYYLEPYSMCMELRRAIINRNEEKYLLDMTQVTWRNAFNVISKNLFSELQNHVQIHNNDNLIYMKIVTYAYLSYKDMITNHISRYFNFDIPLGDIMDLFSKIFNLICMYDQHNQSDVELQNYASSVMYDICYLVLSAYIAKSSTYDYFQYTRENVISNTDEVIDVRRKSSMNISSRIFPFLSNISSIHRGYPFNLTNIEALIYDIRTRTFDTYNIAYINNRTIQNFRIRLRNNNHFQRKLQNLRANKEPFYPNSVPQEVYDAGIAYAGYVQQVIKNIISLCPEDIVIDPPITRDNNKRQNIIYILKLLKPFFNILFEEFSSKRYPLGVDTDTSLPPRMNHNGLNHLRSVYFTAYVLETSNFMDTYGIDNNELFLILLSSYFLSITRFDEYDPARFQGNGILFTAAEFYGLHGMILNNASQYFYQYDFDCSHLRYLSNLFIADVFQIIKEKIPQLRNVANPARFNIDNALYLNALSSDHIYVGVGAGDPNSARIIDFTSILSLGHYFDHVRPTTGYSQLDNNAPGNPNPKVVWSVPRGPIRLYDFITKFYPAAPNDWTTPKSFYYSRIYQTLQESGFRNRVLRDQFPIDSEFGLRADTRQSDNNIFYPNVTYNFDAMSNDFHLAWKNIFASFFDPNYNVQPGTWVTQDGVYRNNRDAP
jgi:hypothetical protein